MRVHTATTRVTLLACVRDGADRDAWSQFEATYREMLLRFCRSRGLQHADAEDAIQLVFTKLVTGLRRFEYDRTRGRFRDYLYRCVRSAIADLSGCPKHVPLPVENGGARDAVPEDPQSRQQWEREWIDHHYRMAIESVRRTSDPRSVEVFEATLAGLRTRQIAEHLGMTEDAVYKAQQRVRDRLRARIASQVREEDGLDA